jgi:hypothetical protein
MKEIEMKHRHILTTTVAILTLTICLSYGVQAGAAVPDSPDGTVKAVAEGLTQNQPQVLWQAMPASYQEDLTALTREFAAKMDATVYDKIFAVLQKTVDLAKTKKEFILASSFMEMAEAKRADIENGYDGVVELLETILNSEISNIESLSTIDYERFLSGTGARVMEQAAAISKMSGDDPFTTEFKDKLNGATYELVSSEGDSAVVRATAADGESELLDLVRVEGRWVPKEMADEWAESIGGAREKLAAMTDEEIAQSRVQIMMGVAMAESFVDQIAATTTQEEFNTVIQGLIGGFLGGGGEETEEEAIELEVEVGEETASEEG